MSVDIPADILPFVERMVAAGQFKSESEVVAAALRSYQQDFEYLRKEVLPALSRAEAGEGVIVSEQELAVMKADLRSRVRSQVDAEKRGHG